MFYADEITSRENIKSQSRTEFIANGSCADKIYHLVKLRLFRIILGGWIISLANPVSAQHSNTMVLGTPRPDDSYAGVMLRRTFKELYQRLDLPIEIKTMPVARLSVELAAGRLDGELARPLDFADTQPGLVRIAEPIMTIRIGFWSFRPQPMIYSLEQLAEAGLSVSYTRGVVECERMLQSALPPKLVTSVTTSVMALRMLSHGRNDVHCGIDASVLSDASSFELPSLPQLIKLFSAGEEIPLYFYLQRRHAKLGPRIEAELKKMRSEGVLNRIRKEALEEYKLASFVQEEQKGHSSRPR